MNYAEDLGFQITWFIGGAAISAALGMPLTPFAAFIAGRAIADLVQILLPQEASGEENLVRWAFRQGEYDGSSYRVTIDIGSLYNAPELKFKEQVIPAAGGKATFILSGPTPPLRIAGDIFYQAEVAAYDSKYADWLKVVNDVLTRMSKGQGVQLPPPTAAPPTLPVAPPVTPPPTTAPAPTYKCAVCGQTFPSQTALNSHYTSVHPTSSQAQAVLRAAIR